MSTAKNDANNKKESKYQSNDLNFIDENLIIVDEINETSSSSNEAENGLESDSNSEIQFLGEVKRTHAMLPAVCRKRSLTTAPVFYKDCDAVFETKRPKLIDIVRSKRSPIQQPTTSNFRPSLETTNFPNNQSYLNMEEVLPFAFTDFEKNRSKAPKLDENTWMEIEKYKKSFPRKFDNFSRQIARHYEQNIQNDLTYSWKMGIRNKILNIIKQYFTEAELFVVGSTINGCGSYNADMDLCCSLNRPNYVNERNFAIKSLRKIKSALYRHKFYLSMDKCILISAKVPILRITFTSKYSELEVDLNVNNLAGVYNSYLVHYYSRIDDRFPMLCLLVKHWAKSNSIGNAMHGMLNSYSLILLVIHFLQAAISPPILPNLQKCFPEIFNDKRPLNQCALFQNLEKRYSDPALNKRTLGELLIAFFDYYQKFDFKNYAISIACACVFSRSELEESTHRFKIFIEEPFDKHNTARCVTSDDNFNSIRRCFKDARDNFRGNTIPDIKRIGVLPIFKIQN